MADLTYTLVMTASKGSSPARLIPLTSCIRLSLHVPPACAEVHDEESRPTTLMACRGPELSSRVDRGLGALSESVDTMRRSCDVTCMELTVADAAQIAGVSTRTVQRALEDGSLDMARTIGRQTTTDDLAVQAWIRTTTRGRKWSGRTRDAALDLLSNGRGDMVSPVRAIPAASGLAGSLRPAARFIDVDRHVVEVSALGTVDVHLIGPSAVDPADLGIVAGESWMRFAEVLDLDELEATQPVSADPDGDLVVIERPHDGRRARSLVDTYVLGDARESAADARELEAVAHAL